MLIRALPKGGAFLDLFNRGPFFRVTEYNIKCNFIKYRLLKWSNRLWLIQNVR